MSFVSLNNPINKVIFGPRKRILIEKIKKNDINDYLKHKTNYTLSFFGEQGTTKLNVFSTLSIPIKDSSDFSEYMSLHVDVIDNTGDTDGSEFIKWIETFINFASYNYNFNIYNSGARDLNLEYVDKNIKFILCGCTVKNAMFFDRKKTDNKELPQFSLELAVKSGFVAS